MRAKVFEVGDVKGFMAEAVKGWRLKRSANIMEAGNVVRSVWANNDEVNNVRHNGEISHPITKPLLK